MRKNRRTGGGADPYTLALAYLGTSDAKEVRMRRIVEGHIRRVLDAADGNLTLTADLLGVNRRTMQRFTKRRPQRRAR